MTGIDAHKTRIYLSERLNSPLSGRRSFDESAKRFRISVGISTKVDKVNPTMAVKVAMPSSKYQGDSDNRKRTNSGMIPGVENYDGIRFDPKQKGGPGKVFKFGTRYADRTNPTNSKPNWGWVDAQKRTTREDVRNLAFAQNKPAIRIRRFDTDKRTGEIIESSEVELNPLSVSGEPTPHAKSSKQLPGNTIGQSVPGGSLLGRAARVAGILTDADGKMRCPPGTPAANQFTDATGSNCFGLSATELLKGAARLAERFFGGDSTFVGSMFRNLDPKPIPGVPTGMSNTPGSWRRMGATTANAGRVIWEDKNGKQRGIPTHWVTEESASTHRQFKNGLARGKQFARDQDGRMSDLMKTLKIDPKRARGGWDTNNDLIEAANKLRDSGVMTTLFNGRPSSEAELDELIMATLLKRDRNFGGLDESSRRGLFIAEKKRYLETERAMLTEFIDSVMQNPDHMRTINELIWDPASLINRSENEAAAAASFGQGFTPDSSVISMDIPKMLDNMAAMLPEIEEYHRLRIDALGGTDAANAQALTDFLVSVNAFSKETAAMINGPRGWARHVMAHEIAHTKQFRMLYQNIQDAVDADGNFTVPGTKKVVSSAAELTNEDMIRCINAFIGGKLDIPAFNKAMMRTDAVMFLSGKYPNEYFNDGDPVKYLEAMAELDALRSLGVIHGTDIDNALAWQDEIADTRFLADRNLTNNDVISTFNQEYVDFLSGNKVDSVVQQTILQRESDRYKKEQASERARKLQEFKDETRQLGESEIVSTIADLELEEEILREKMEANPDDYLLAREWAEANSKMKAAKEVWHEKYGSDFPDKQSANTALNNAVNGNREAGEKFKPSVLEERKQKRLREAEREAAKLERERQAAERAAAREKKDKERAEREVERARAAEERAKKNLEKEKERQEKAAELAKRKAEAARQKKFINDTKDKAAQLNSEEVIDELATIETMLRDKSLSRETKERLVKMRDIFRKRYTESRQDEDPELWGKTAKISRERDKLIRQKLGLEKVTTEDKIKKPSEVISDVVAGDEPVKKDLPPKMPRNKAAVKKIADSDRAALLEASTPEERQAILDLSDPETSITSQLLDPDERLSAVKRLTKRSDRRAKVGIEESSVPTREADIERHVNDVLIPSLELIEKSSVSRPFIFETELDIGDTNLDDITTSGPIKIDGFIHGPIIHGDRPQSTLDISGDEPGVNRHRLIIQTEKGQKGFFPNWSDTSSERPKDYEQKFVMPPGKVEIVEKRLEKDGSTTLIGRVVEQSGTEQILDSITNGPDSESIPKSVRSKINKITNKHITERRKSGKFDEGTKTPLDIQDDIHVSNEVEHSLIESAGGGIGQVSADYVADVDATPDIGDEVDSEVFGKVTTTEQRKAERLNKINSIVEELLNAYEDGRVSDELEIDSSEVDPRVIELLETSSPEEIEAILTEEARDIHESLDKRPRVIVREDELDSITETGEYSADAPGVPDIAEDSPEINDDELITPEPRPIKKPGSDRPRRNLTQRERDVLDAARGGEDKGIEAADKHLQNIENMVYGNGYQGRQNAAGLRTADIIEKNFPGRELADLTDEELLMVKDKLNEMSNLPMYRDDKRAMSQMSSIIHDYKNIRQMRDSGIFRVEVTSASDMQFQDTLSRTQFADDLRDLQLERLKELDRIAGEKLKKIGISRDGSGGDDLLPLRPRKLNSAGAIEKYTGLRGNEPIPTRPRRTSSPTARQVTGIQLDSRGERGGLKTRVTSRLLKAALDRSKLEEDRKQTILYAADVAMRLKTPAGQASVAKEVAQQLGREGAMWMLKKKLSSGDITPDQFSKLSRVVDKFAPQTMPDEVMSEIKRGIISIDSIIDERIATPENMERLRGFADSIRSVGRRRNRDGITTPTAGTSLASSGERTRTILDSAKSLGIDWRGSGIQVTPESRAEIVKDSSDYIKRLSTFGIFKEVELTPGLTKLLDEFVSGENNADISDLRDRLKFFFWQTEEGKNLAKSLGISERDFRNGVYPLGFRAAIDRQIALISGDNEAVKKIDAFTRFMADEFPNMSDEEISKLVRTAILDFNDNLSAPIIQTTDVKRIVEGRGGLTVHDFEEMEKEKLPGATQTFSPSYTADIRTGVEQVFGFPKRNSEYENPEEVRKLRPSSGHSVARDVVNQRQDRLRKIYGDDFESMYDFPIGSELDAQGTARAYGPSHMILDDSVKGRTKIMSGDSASGNGTQNAVNMDEAEEHAALLGDVDGILYSHIAGRPFSSLAGPSNPLRNDTSLKYNETLTLGRFEPSEVKAIYADGLEQLRLEPGKTEKFNPDDAGNVSLLIDAAKTRDKLLEERGMELVFSPAGTQKNDKGFITAHKSRKEDSLLGIDNVELFNPTMTKVWVDRNPDVFSDVPEDILIPESEPETTPYEALLRALIHNGGGKGFFFSEERPGKSKEERIGPDTDKKLIKEELDRAIAARKRQKASRLASAGSRNPETELEENNVPTARTLGRNTSSSLSSASKKLEKLLSAESSEIKPLDDLPENANAAFENETPNVDPFKIFASRQSFESPQGAQRANRRLGIGRKRNDDEMMDLIDFPDLDENDEVQLPRAADVNQVVNTPRLISSSQGNALNNTNNVPKGVANRDIDSSPRTASRGKTQYSKYGTSLASSGVRSDDSSPVIKNLTAGDMDTNPGTALVGNGKFEARTWSIGKDKVVFGVPDDMDIDSDEGIVRMPLNPYQISGLDMTSKEGRDAAYAWVHAISAHGYDSGYKEDSPSYVSALLFAASRGDDDAKKKLDDLAERGQQLVEEQRKSQIDSFIKEVLGRAEGDIAKEGLSEGINIDDIVLVHETKWGIEKDNDGNVLLRPAVDYGSVQRDGDGNPILDLEGKEFDLYRETLHFALNHVVDGHSARQSLGDGSLIIVPLRSVLEANPDSLDSLYAIDTFLSPPPGEPLRLPGAKVIEFGKDKPLSTSDTWKAMEELGAKRKFDAGVHYSSPGVDASIAKLSIGNNMVPGVIHDNTPQKRYERIRVSENRKLQFTPDDLAKMSKNNILRTVAHNRFIALSEVRDRSEDVA